ncbi:MAG: hypothetical protein EOM66_09585, partial [Clostridia bacterium]|nr:hypothetical protein [Clostridia bacterium]
MMKHCKAAIFDVDGTLIDSMDVWERIDTRFLANRGINVPKGYMDAIAPMGFLRAARYTIDLFSLSETPEELVVRGRQAGLSAMALTDHDNVLGVPEALAEAERIGVRLL